MSAKAWICQCKTCIGCMVYDCLPFLQSINYGVHMYFLSFFMWDIIQCYYPRLEAESLRNCTAKYCALQPAPRSTIAAAFSPDGSILASTQYDFLNSWITSIMICYCPSFLLVKFWCYSGDHTVKLFCCKTGICLKTLCGHRRTPWVVSEIMNSWDYINFPFIIPCWTIIAKDQGRK